MTKSTVAEIIAKFERDISWPLGSLETSALIASHKALVEALKLSLFQTQCRIEILERCKSNDGGALQQAIKARDAGFAALKAAGVKMTDDIPADLVERCAAAVHNHAHHHFMVEREIAIAVLREAGVPEMAEALEELEPYLDAIVCYASTMEEHKPNRLVHNARAALSRYRGVLREATTINWVRISTHGYPEHRRRLLILTDDKKEDAALGWFQGFYRDQPEWQIKPVSWLPFKPAYWAYLEFPRDEAEAP